MCTLSTFLSRESAVFSTHRRDAKPPQRRFRRRATPNRPGLLAHGGGWARGAAARCVACARGPDGSHWDLDPLDPSAGSGHRAPRMWRLTSVRLVRDTSVDHSRARAAQACLCSQMAVQLISLVNCPTTMTRNPRPCRRKIHAMPESHACLVLLCLGWSTTLCGDGSRWKRLCMNWPWTATTVLLSAAPDMSPSRASRTAWNAVTATALAVRGNAGYSFTLTSNTQPHSTTASMQMHLP